MLSVKIVHFIFVGFDMLQGSMVAIVTPMFDDGSLDLNALRSLIDFHIDAGTDGIVIVGESRQDCRCVVIGPSG